MEPQQGEECLTVHLVDFHQDLERTCGTLHTYLKSKLGTLNCKPFSLLFNQVYSLTQSESKPYTCYDMVLYGGLIILGGRYQLHLYNRFTKEFKKSISISVATHGMHVPENSCHLYVTGIDEVDGESKCFKFNLNVLLGMSDSGSTDSNSNGGLIWKTVSGILKSCWGVSVLNDRVYVVDLSVFVFNVENGQKEEDLIFNPDLDGGSGFGIVFTPEKEMILSRSSFFTFPSSPIEIYKLNQDSGIWSLIRKAEVNALTDRGSYGIFYEKSTQFIYQIDRKAKAINVFQKQTMERVKTFNIGTINHYAIHLDEKLGELILPTMKGSALIYN